RWGQACVDGLTVACDEINRLNVFPVADSDTGTNLLFTMRSAMDAVARRTSGHASAGAVASAMATGATTGARGNSGIILSQVLRGLAAAAARHGPLTTSSLRDALDTAAALVRTAVSDPVEGTIVTVLDCAALAAGGCPADASLEDIADAAAEAAGAALERTTKQLAVLEDAGVVDAGGRGLLVLLDSLVTVVGGHAPVRRRFEGATLQGEVGFELVHASAGDLSTDDLEYEVMYLIADTDEDRVAVLREALGRIGDSIIVVPGADGEAWSLHVHTADPGAAVEVGLVAGRVHQIRISAFSEGPLGVGIPDHLPSDRFVPARGSADRGVLAVVSGSGAAELFVAAGATVLRCDGEIRAMDLLAAIRKVPHREVLVLPNGALRAEELVAVGVAARDADHDVLLLPSASMVQGLASLAVHDRGRIAVDDTFAMSEAGAATRWGSVRIAPERSLTVVGTCEQGDGLGLVGHEIVVIEPDVTAAATVLLDRMLGLGGELVTLLVGADAPADLVPTIEAHIAMRFWTTEVVVYHGGQRADLLQLGVE
ncbi:MAG TPA: DAK2 domain-containing protein, partial [Aldersonia sp.]